MIATPSTALKANTTYELTIATYEPYRSTFTTGTAIDLEPSAFAGLAALIPETMTYPIERDGAFCQSSCVERLGSDHVSRLELGYANPSDAALLVLELYRADAPTQVTTVAFSGTAPIHELGYDTCSLRSPLLEPEVEYCARLVAYDIAGNRSTAIERCSETTRCAPALDEQGCSPAATCEPAGGGGCATGPDGAGVMLALFGFAFVRRRR